MHIHVFSLPVSQTGTENVRLKNGIMGIASLLKDVGVIFEQFFGLILINCHRIVKTECPL